MPDRRPGRVVTIGYQGRTVVELVDELEAASVDIVVDVRGTHA